MIWPNMEPHPVQTVEYEQCPYDLLHILEIYRDLDSIQADSCWHSFNRGPRNCSAFYRVYDRYFQAVFGNSADPLFQEFLNMEPMKTEDDSEWMVEKHGPGEYLVRTTFTQTFGPTHEMKQLDRFLTPYGLWLEDQGGWVSGAATFQKLSSDSLLEASKRLQWLEQACLEANRQIKEALNSYWGEILGLTTEMIRELGKPDFSVETYGPKKRTPLTEEEAFDAFESDSYPDE